MKNRSGLFSGVWMEAMNMVLYAFVFDITFFIYWIFNKQIHDLHAVCIGAIRMYVKINQSIIKIMKQNKMPDK